MTLPRATNPGGTNAPQPGSSASPAAGSLGKDTIAALQTALASEHAALWAYGVVAAYDPSANTTITDMVTSHQGARDIAANLVVQGGATPVGPHAAYTSPKPVTDKATALSLALAIESDCADAWRAVIGSTDDPTLRGTALTSLSDAAMRMVTWRKAAGSKTVTAPFPGNPQTS